MIMERHETRQVSMLDTLLSVRKGMIAWLLAHLWTTTLLGVDYWQPLTDPNLRAVIASEDRIVAVGDPGYVVMSTNGIDWQQCEVPTVGILTSVAYGNGKYLAVGRYGDAIYSDDGAHWQRIHLGVTNHLRSVYFLGNQFVVTILSTTNYPNTGIHAGYLNQILISTNLLDWKLSTVTISSTVAFFQAAIECEGRYLFAGYNATYGITTDFTAWEKPTYSWNFPYHAQKFCRSPWGLLAVGNFGSAGETCSFTPKIGLSTNITDWEWTPAQIPDSRPLTGIAFGNGSAVAVGDGGLCYHYPNGGIALSTNGVNWSVINLAPDEDLYDVCFFKDHFIAVGHRGLILRSADGVEWAEVQSMRPALPTMLHDVTFSDGLFVAVGPNSIMTSPNGALWDVRATNTSSSLWSITKGTNGWIAVGDNGFALHSPDGIAWQQQTSLGSNSLGGVAYGPYGFVAVSGNTNESIIFHSADGHAWTEQTVPATNLFKVIYGGDYYVAVGSGNVVESTDGISWVTRTLTNSIAMTRIIYAAGLYLAGSEHQILYSSDRTNWIQAATTYRNRRASHALAYGPAGLVAAGRGYVIQSQDGFLWRDTHSLGTATTLHPGAAYGAGCYVIVGNQSYISRNLLPRVRIMASENPNVAQLSVSTDLGLPFVVQSTESLTNPEWQDLPAMSFTNAYESFEIPTEGTPKRFYRAVSRH